MIHQAGPLTSAGVQLCARCGYLLNDYRNTMVPDGTPQLRGWAVDASVQVQNFGYMRASNLVEAQPDCERAH